MMEQIIIVVTAIVTAIPDIAATAARYRPLIEKALGKYRVLEEKARSALTVAENAMQAGQEIEETLMKSIKPYRISDSAKQKSLRSTLNCMRTMRCYVNYRNP